MVNSAYDPSLVALSFAVAVFASYTALDLGSRVRGASDGQRWGWVAAAAVAMGGGIWSMHFIGMLAFRMPVPVTYDVGVTAVSFLLAVGLTGAAFAWVSRRGARAGGVLLSGPLLGLGVAGMHYTGMAAMRMPGMWIYRPTVVLASVLVAVTAATVALWLTFRQNTAGQKLAAAVVMGVAVAGMHYTGMAAAAFRPDANSGPHAGLHAIELGQQNLALVVAGTTFLILFLGLFAGSVRQRRVQRHLFASEARFRAAAKAVGDIIWTNDATGRMTGPQPDWQQFTGQTEAECQGFGWAEAVHPDDVEPTTTAWNAAVAARGEFICEHRVRRRDGVYRRFAIRAVPVLTEQGEIREWVGVHADITDRRESEAKLAAARDAAEAANRAKSTFIANMSHELRTPLSAIIGYAEMILEDVEAGGEAADFVGDMRKIETNARHLLGLINDVLDLSKVESGKMDVYAERFDAAAVLQEVAQASLSLVDRNGNRLVLDLAADLGTLDQDLMKVKQILLNLLGNAAKFTENGTITLGADRPAGGDTVRLWIRDTGIGIADDQLPKLFQRFQQADNSTTRRFGGSGLGLSLTQALAEMLGGTISVESQPGRGSTFTVTLPMVYAALTPRAIDDQESPAGSGPDGSADVVLVIDDDSHQRALMARFLQREGFAARTAPDGEAGLELARNLKPRAILLDVVMPEMDGWAVLRALKADPDLSRIPVVMVTFLDQRGLAASLGASDYVLKPVQWEKFKSVMDAFKDQDNVRPGSGADRGTRPEAQDAEAASSA